MSRALLFICLLAFLVVATAGEGVSVIDRLKARIESGTAASPCSKAVPAGPAPPKQFLDQRLPLVVDDYHPPVGGFNPSHIPDKEVDVAARKILREIEAAEAEAKLNGDAPAAVDPNTQVMTTEEHKAMKQLLLDADILVRAAAKSLSENGPIEEAKAVKKVVKSAVKKAAKAEKKANKKVKSSKKDKKAKKDKKSKKVTSSKPKSDKKLKKKVRSAAPKPKSKSKSSAAATGAAAPASSATGAAGATGAAAKKL